MGPINLDGLAFFAVIGFIALVIGLIVAVIGIPFGLWWLWNNVSIGWIA